MKATSPEAQEVWSLIKETQKNIKDLSVSQKQTDKSIKDLSVSQKQTDKSIKDLSVSQKQTDKSIKDLSVSQKQTDKSIKDLSVSQKQTDKSIKDLSVSQKQTDKSIKDLSVSQKQTDKSIKDLSVSQKQTDRQIQKIGGRFNQRWGALVESLVEGKLVRIFQNRRIDITQTHTRSQSEWRKPDGRIERREFDIIVANGTEVVVVEVKTTLTPKDINGFLETLKDFKNYFPRYKSETIYGVVAYLASENKAHLLAEEEGLFLIRATGDSASLVNKEGFKPKSF